MAPPEELTKSRAATNGNYMDTAKYAQDLKQILHRGKNWPTLTAQKQESLELIMTKISRILSGDPQFPDHWDDIAGYAYIAHIAVHEV